MIESSNQILESAVSAARSGDLDGAREHYRRLLEQHPDHPEGLFALGSLEIAAGRPADAEIHFRGLSARKSRSASRSHLLQIQRHRSRAARGRALRRNTRQV